MRVSHRIAAEYLEPTLACIRRPSIRRPSRPYFGVIFSPRTVRAEPALCLCRTLTPLRQVKVIQLFISARPLDRGDRSWTSSVDILSKAHGPGQPGSLLNAEYMAAFTDPSEVSEPTRQMIYGLMRHAPGKRGRLVDALMPPPPVRPTSWKDDEFKRDEDSSKMPKLWGTGRPAVAEHAAGTQSSRSVSQPDRLATQTPERMGRRKL